MLVNDQQQQEAIRVVAGLLTFHEGRDVPVDGAWLTEEMAHPQLITLPPHRGNRV